LSLGVTVERFFLALSGPLAFDKAIITGAAISLVSKFDIEFMMLLGLVLTAVFLVTLFALRRRESFLENRVALAIALFGLASTALIALSRSSLGLEQAVSSRYTTACSIFLIGLLLLLRSLSHSLARLRIPLISLITLVILANVYATLGEWYIGRYRRAFFVNWSNAVRNYASATDEELKNPLNTPQEIRDYSKVMEKYHLNVFSNQQRAGEK
jgi:glucan phosphoethanolaminetransferase (alkaline phosphatase superfamily)